MKTITLAMNDGQAKGLGYVNNVAGAVAGIRTHVAAILWVNRPALNPPRHKSTPATRQTRVWPSAYHTIPPFFISEWSLPAGGGGGALPPIAIRGRAALQGRFWKASFPKIGCDFIKFS